MDTRTPPTDTAPRRVLIRRKEVEELTGLSRSTLYAWMRQGRFPQSRPDRAPQRALVPG